MKVRCIKTNSEDLAIGRDAVSYFDSLHDLGRPSEQKTYTPTVIGYESHVYAIKIKNGHASYYIKHPKFGDLVHVPSVCFEILDPRISKLWCIDHDYVEVVGRRQELLGEFCSRTTMAIKEWIDEPRFLEFYLDGKEREVRIMNNAVRQMDAEFE